MLKITSRNEKLKRKLARKEMTYFFNKLFHCFFVSPSRSKSKPRRISKSQILKFQFQRYLTHWTSKLLFHSPFTKAQTVCFLTGRARSVYRAFRLSRLKIREYAGMGYFVGLSKASW